MTQDRPPGSLFPTPKEKHLRLGTLAEKAGASQRDVSSAFQGGRDHPAKRTTDAIRVPTRRESASPTRDGACVSDGGVVSVSDWGRGQRLRLGTWSASPIPAVVSAPPYDAELIFEQRRRKRPAGVTRSPRRKEISGGLLDDVG